MALVSFICDALMWQRDAVSEIIWASTWLRSRAFPKLQVLDKILYAKIKTGKDEGFISKILF